MKKYGYPVVAEREYISSMTKTSKILLISVVNESRKEVDGNCHADI